MRFLTKTIVGGAGCCLDLLHVLWPLAGTLSEELHCVLLFAPEDDHNDDDDSADDDSDDVLHVPDVDVGEPTQYKVLNNLAT